MYICLTFCLSLGLYLKFKKVGLSYKIAPTYSVPEFRVFLAGERPGALAGRCIVHSPGSVTESLLPEGLELRGVPISVNFLLTAYQP